MSIHVKHLLFQMFFSQEKFNTRDLKAHHFFKLPFLNERFEIMEIGTTKDIMFTFTHSNIYVVLPKV
jgi:hypothetical protein